jgi:hypothetical protein
MFTSVKITHTQIVEELYNQKKRDSKSYVSVLFIWVPILFANYCFSRHPPKERMTGREMDWVDCIFGVNSL